MQTNQQTSPAKRHQTALVLGASGGIGGAVAQALARRGWTVRGLARDTTRAAAADAGRERAIEWRAGDAMKADDVLAASQGVQVIVHAVNPPGYRDWEKLVLPMIDNTIAAARAVGARILLPGTIYNHDPARTPVIHEGSAQQPRTRKGAIRVALEQRLEAAAQDAVRPVPTLIVRAGDFYGPQVRSSWFSQAMVTPGKPVTRLRLLARDTGHSWAYLPDLAEAMARLLEHPALRTFESVGFEGFWDADGHALPALVAAAVGRPHLPETAFPWWLMRLAAPLGGFPREAVDVLPYWQHPVRIDNTRLVELLGAEPRTHATLAMRRTLEGLGCLPGAGRSGHVLAS